MLSAATSTSPRIYVPKPRRILPVEQLISNWALTITKDVVLNDKWWESHIPNAVGGSCHRESVDVNYAIGSSSNAESDNNSRNKHVANLSLQSEHQIVSYSM